MHLPITSTFDDFVFGKLKSSLINVNFFFSTNWINVLCGLLEHPWIIEYGDFPDIPIDCVVLSRIKQFRAMNELKKLALT